MAADRYEFDVDWTDDELAHYRRAERRRSVKGRYWPYAVLVGIGFLTATLALVTDVVRPRDARVIAVLGSLAALAGWFTAVWAWHRQQRLASDWDIRRRYRVVVDAAGMRFSDPDTDSLVHWSGVTGIETSPRFIWVGMRARRDICLPSRYVGSEEARGAFAAFVRRNIESKE